MARIFRNTRKADIRELLVSVLPEHIALLCAVKPITSSSEVGIRRVLLDLGLNVRLFPRCVLRRVCPVDSLNITEGHRCLVA